MFWGILFIFYPQDGNGKLDYDEFVKMMLMYWDVLFHLHEKSIMYLLSFNPWPNKESVLIEKKL